MMFKDSRLPLMVETTVIVDKGYQGITKIHANSLIPFKTSKKHKLTPNQKKHNFVIERKRIVIEHVNRYLKRFRLLSSRYRNKQKRFTLRFALIAGIFNFQHQLLVSE
ncbi:MAG: transposase [Selenomonadaceae bacterium]|nr:transposase [Selenomonadaceae bacterium]